MAKFTRSEVWANGPRWRMITVFRTSLDVQYQWGKYDKDVDYFLKMFHGNLASAMDGAHGQGSERWYRRHRNIDEQMVTITNLRKSCEKAGFRKLGMI